MPDDKYSELERLRQVAFLPWHIDDDWTWELRDSKSRLVASLARSGHKEFDRGAESLFIVAACNAIGDLIAELRAKDARIQALEASIRFANAARQAKE